MRESQQRFWASALQAPLVILSDFDATITAVDVGALLSETLAPPAEETRRRFRSGEIGSRLYWQDTMAWVDMEKGLAAAEQVDADPTLPRFVSWCEQNAVPFAVVSDGFGFYIRAILARAGLDRLPVFCNEMNGPGALGFPESNPACDRCGCCKAAIVKDLKANGARIIYAGDGGSDIYAVSFADWIFARGRLSRYLADRGVPFTPLNTFADLQRTIGTDLERFRSGQAPGRAELAVHSLCRFEP